MYSNYTYTPSFVHILEPRNSYVLWGGDQLYVYVPMPVGTLVLPLLVLPHCMYLLVARCVI